MIELALGFAFNSTKSQVLLLQKNKPTFMRGYWTGVGGHREPEDGSMADTMAREFSEEATIWVGPHLWKPVGEPFFRGPEQDLKLYVFSTVLDEGAACRARSGTADEPVRWFSVEDALKNRLVYWDTPDLIRQCL